MTRGLRRGVGRLALDDQGVTIIEVVVAGMLLAVSSLAVLGLVDAANRNNFRSEQSQVVNDRLQQEMEELKQLPYNALALTSLPTPASPSDPNDPNSRVTGTTFNVNRSGVANYEDLAYSGGTKPGNGTPVSDGQVEPGPTPFESGNVRGSIHRYVTWEADPACGSATSSNCGERFYKRIVVAITLSPTASAGTRVYQEIQGYVGNPNAGLPTSQGGEGGPDEGGPGPGPGDPDTPTPWTFWLTDTPCSPEPAAEQRQPITGDHAAHNTLGDCSSEGTGPGRPDLMFTEAAPCTNPGCDNQPLYDYATDVEPDQGPDLDTGLQLLTPPDPEDLGCGVNISNVTELNRLGPVGGPTPWLFVHKWLSPPVPPGFSDVVLDGTGTLDLWTQSINGATYPGKLCVWLFVRETIAGVPVDTFAVNLDDPSNPVYFTHSQMTWPTTAWDELAIPLHFAAINGQAALEPLRIPAGARLGVAIGVERQGTSPNTGLQFMYDAPTFDSRLEVETHSIVPSLPL